MSAAPHLALVEPAERRVINVSEIARQPTAAAKLLILQRDRILELEAGERELLAELQLARDHAKRLSHG